MGVHEIHDLIVHAVRLAPASPNCPCGAVLEMVSHQLAADPAKPRIELSVPEYFQRNFHITTSGMFSDPPLRCAIDTLGVDKVLFAVDHPFSDGAKARRWIDQAAISEDERTKITHQNAERLLGS